MEWFSSRVNVLRSLTLLLVFCSLANALELSPLYGNGAVLQRDMHVPVWGWAEEGSKVTVEFAGQKVEGVAGKEGRWEAKLAPLKLNKQPQVLKVSSGDKAITRNNLLVGDVWICSGQSNMEMSFSGKLFRSDLPATIKPDEYGMIRHFKVLPVTSKNNPKDVFTHAQARFHSKASWEITSSTTYQDFSAVGFFFAQQLVDAHDVPIGLLNLTRGNTRIDSFMTEASADYIEEQVPKSKLRGIFKTEVPFAVYNSQVSPAVGFPVKGAIWYQGEANAKEADIYHWKLEALIRGWRDSWAQGDFPFYFVQLPSYDTTQDWAGFRAGQQKALRVKESGMAVTTDVGDAMNSFPMGLHPQNKFEVGKRLSLWARAKDYGEAGLVHSGPLFRDAEFSGSAVTISFDHVGSGLQIARKASSFSIEAPKPMKKLVGFELAGSDKVWHLADAKIEGQTVVLTSASVKNPKQARFNWASNTEAYLATYGDYVATPNAAHRKQQFRKIDFIPDAGTLYNKEGLPAAPFTTAAQ